MNNDICPVGTWDWLAHLGYSRADVERIVAQRHLAVTLEAAHLAHHPQIIDAEPMSAKAIRFRRREALRMRYPLHRASGQGKLPFGLGPEHFEGRN